MRASPKSSADLADDFALALALAEALADGSALLDAFCVCDEQAAILKASTPIPRTLIRFFFITFSFFMFIKL